jgi:hypothetical protein
MSGAQDGPGPEPRDPGPQPTDPGDEPPTEPMQPRWTGSAPVPPPASGHRRRRRAGPDPTLDLPEEDEWPPVPPRPPNSPVTAPYPPPPPGPYPPPVHAPNPAARAVPPYPQSQRRRRRWPWVLAFLVILTLGCCGCCYAWARPYLDEYPALVMVPSQAAGLVLIDDADARRETAVLEGKIRAKRWFAEDVFAAVYAEPGTQRRVTLFGTTEFLLSPERDLAAGMDGLSGDLRLTDIRKVDPGPLGGYARCGTGRRDGQAVAVCAWADHGSMAVALFADRNLDDSAALLRDLREALISRS